jgi:hypothetical protein
MMTEIERQELELFASADVVKRMCDELTIIKGVKDKRSINIAELEEVNELSEWIRWSGMSDKLITEKIQKLFDAIDKMHELSIKMRASGIGPPTKTRALCGGCREDYYNQPGNSEKGCWCFESGVLGLYKIVGINDVPPWNHAPEYRLKCYKRVGAVTVPADRAC